MATAPAPADPRRFPFPPGIPPAAWLAGWLLERVWPIAIAWPEWARPIGWFLLLAPWAFAIWAVRTFRRQGTVVDPRGNVTTVVTTGPFRITRNPMYLTLVTSYLGGTLAFHLEWGFVLLIPVVLALHFGVILREERYLEAKFGDAYREYRRRVRRWF
jgi:protein-S-isoprenylcysteine O-methyltransferase Ste14